MGDRKYGRADFPEIHLLPEWVIDSPMDRPEGVKYGQAQFAQIELLPEIVINAGDTFILRVVPPAGKGPDEIAADLQPLFVALVACEAALGGTGLRFDPVPGGPGAVAFCVSAADPPGAAERLRVIRDIVNGANVTCVPRELVEKVGGASGEYNREALPA